MKYSLPELSVSNLNDLYVESSYYSELLRALSELIGDDCNSLLSLRLPLIIFSQHLQSLAPKDYLETSISFQNLADQIITEMTGRGYLAKKQFIKNSFEQLSPLFQLELKANQQSEIDQSLQPFSLYRTFDSIDTLLELNYETADEKNYSSLSAERLYEGAGVGVQSSFASIIMAIDLIETESPLTIVDLGSGYGRFGFALGLLRPDVNFFGFEFVNHRVIMSNATCRNLNIENQIHFITQDLSVLDFKIPVADIYYMYDPFTSDTYRHVLNQLLQISKDKRIRIITKGNSIAWLREFAEENHWQPPIEIDGKNLFLYSSSAI